MVEVTEGPRSRTTGDWKTAVTLLVSENCGTDLVLVGHEGAAGALEQRQQGMPVEVDPHEIAASK
jgi:hypothetical protein